MIFSLNDIESFLSNIDKSDIIKKKNMIYYNLSCSFDIETSSFYESLTGVVYTNEQYRIALESDRKLKAEKKAIMYIWQFAIDDNVIYGRTWEQFNDFINRLYDFLDLEHKYLIVYVHNLSYEFQFICKRFNWVEIFADTERKPIMATCDKNIIFQCSYRLSGYSLQVVANNLQNKELKKMCGDLDYSLLRNSKTPLSDKELGYCFNDVLIVTSFINEQINEYENICNIPLTQTGKVRRYVRKECFINKKYRFMIAKLTIEKLEYIMLQNAFMGGFTHCNSLYTNTICENVTSFDFTSSYPTVLISEKYPMGKGKKIQVNNIYELMQLSKNYSFVVDLTFTGLKDKFIFDNIISYSKCRNIINPIINNGRIVNADKLTLTVTDIDFMNILKFYSFESVEIGICYCYVRDYLPKEIINVILHLYKMKTELKGVENKEVEYLHSKELLNSIYGMCVTSIIHNEVNFNGENWETIQGDIEKALNEYNTDKNRFLYYHWGVWCTAYARNNLYTAIQECKQDYIYSDTDSVKIMNAEKHKKYFDTYNQIIIQKINDCLNHYEIKSEMAIPKTIKGIEKPLGVWDFDGFYKKFKSLGAKRYMYFDGDLHTTICGLSKKKGSEYIKKQGDSFSFFCNGMYVDCDNTGKMTHTYIDKEIKGTLIDYMGNESDYHEKSYIHLENADFSLSLSDLYIQYFTGIQKLYK